MTPDTYTAQGAFNAGKAAYEDHQPLTSNPYPYNTSDFECWRDGWFAAQAKDNGCL